jgi:hypothetical protein
MGVPHEAPSPLDDSSDSSPKWEECQPSGKAEPVRDEPTPENVAVVRQRYRNTFMPHGPELQLTVTAPLAEPSDGSKQAAEENLVRFLEKCKVAIEPDIEFPDGQAPTEKEPLDEDDVEVEKEFTLEILDRSSESDPSRPLIVHIDPRIGKNKAHIYHLVARTTKASARVRATKGKVRMGIMKDDGFVSPLTTNVVGGGSSPTVSAQWPTPTTFSLRVRGLWKDNRYRISTGWKRLG